MAFHIAPLILLTVCTRIHSLVMLMARYTVKLCEKKVKTVWIEAKTGREAIRKAGVMLKKGLTGKGVHAVEYLEYDFE